MNHPHSESQDAVARHRESRRAAGLKLKQVWVPDTRSALFAEELERQCRAVGDDGLAFAEAAAQALDGWK
ncbi:DUF3018 family protein [Xylophilus rhododendri]|uniref:DUF3018 family protein n=1 Tax=Xylophilus rhododendri TaxID=2697032 RepID=A0A857J3A0_9BURK|nr:antitoxin MazE-like protein [Xylophilus rhododendri]QHI98400.1 DUF3018 family protein [Xylophilus rhododendri]